MSEEEIKVIILKESFAESARRYAFTVLSAWAMILPGWLIGSNALQWVGSVLFGLFVMSRVAKTGFDNAKTIPEARKFLDDLERE